MKHTKGKWDYEFNPFSSFSPNGQFTIKAGKVGTPVAVLPMPLGGINTKEKQEANAKLIAAAPELLEALIRCRNVLKEYNSTNSINGYYLAEQTIKKATS